MDKFFDKESGHHQTKPLRKDIGLNGDNSPKQAVGTMRRICRTEVSELETTLRFLCTQNSKPCANFVLLISFTLFTHTRTTLKLLKSWTNSSTRESGHHQTQPLWKEIGLNGDNSPKQAVGTMRKNCRTEVSQLENNFALFVYSIPCANFVLPISFTLFTHTRTTLKLFDKRVEHHQTKPLSKDIGLNKDNSPKQAVGNMRKNCRTEASLLENNLALFVYSKPWTNFVLLISFTLFTHTRTTLKLLKSWTNSSTRESGHHQTKPLRKDIGLNGDNSPKQVVGTMRRICRTEVSELENNFALFVYSKPCANFVLLISFTLFSHTRTTLKLLKSWTNSSTSESNITRQNCSEKKWVSWGQQSEASSRNHAKELQNAKSGCLKTTLHFLCTQNLAQTLSSGFHSHFLLTLVQLSSCWSHGQILRQGSRDITSQKLLWKEIGLNGDNSPKQAVMRKNCGTRSLAAWKQPWAFCVLKTLLKLCPPDFIHTVYSHPYNSQAIRQVSRTSPDKTGLKRNGCQWGQQSEASSRNHAQELRNAKSGCLKTTLHFLCAKKTLRKLCAPNFIHTLYSHSYNSQAIRQVSRTPPDKTAPKGNGYQWGTWMFCTPSLVQGVFVNFPGKRGMTLWLCDALCSKKICFWHDITRGAHLATGPGDCSCRLVLGTGPGDWFSWQSAKSVFAWILLCIHSRSSPTALKSGQHAHFLQEFWLTYCTFS